MPPGRCRRRAPDDVTGSPRRTASATTPLVAPGVHREIDQLGYPFSAGAIDRAHRRLWPGRLERFSMRREVLIDAAHNPDGAAALAALPLAGSDGRGALSSRDAGQGRADAVAAGRPFSASSCTAPAYPPRQPHRRARRVAALRALDGEYAEAIPTRRITMAEDSRRRVAGSIF